MFVLKIIIICVVWLTTFTSLMGQVTGSMFAIPCPPEFPNFEIVFKRSLQNDNLRRMFENIKQEINSDALKCASSDILTKFNKNHCHGNLSLDTQCSTTVSLSTSPSTNAPSVTVLETTSASSVADSKTETVVTLSPVLTTTKTGTSQKTTVQHRDSTSTKLPDSGSFLSSVLDDLSTTWTSVDTSNNTAETKVVIPTPSVREAKSASKENPVVIYVSVFGVLAGLIIVIAVLYQCRKKLKPPNAHLSNMIPKKDRQQESYTRTGSVFDSYSSCNGHTSPQQMEKEKFRTVSIVDSSTPDKAHRFSSDFTADISSSTFLNNNSINSVSNTNQKDSGEQFHFNTLRTIQHPHALTLGGFGESYTDFSLPRSIQKKKKKERPHEDVSLQAISFINTNGRNEYANFNQINKGIRYAPTEPPVEHIYDSPYQEPAVPLHKMLAQRSCSDVGSARRSVNKNVHFFENDLNFSTFKGEDGSVSDKRWSVLESPSRDSGYQSPIYRTNSQLSGQSDSVFSTDSQTTLVRQSSDSSDHSHKNLSYVVSTLPKPNSSSRAKSNKQGKEFKHHTNGWPGSLKRDPREKYKEKKKKIAQPESFVYKDTHYDL